jgi:long-subunit acyl-CoA synthetase (AMP-forming)
MLLRPDPEYNNHSRDTGTLEKLSYEEALERAQQAANQLEDLMCQYNTKPYIRDETRVNYFVSECMVLLANRYVITSPDE